MADEERLEMAGAERKATPSMESTDAALRDEMPRWRRVNGAARGGGGLAGAREQDKRPRWRRKDGSDVLQQKSITGRRLKTRAKESFHPPSLSADLRND